MAFGGFELQNRGGDVFKIYIQIQHEFFIAFKPCWRDFPSDMGKAFQWLVLGPTAFGGIGNQGPWVHKGKQGSMP